MKKNTYDWLINRETRNQDKSDELIEIKQEGLELRLERLSFDDYASVDLGYLRTREPFTLTPQDASHGRSDRVLSFLVFLSGSAQGFLPSGQDFVLDKDWGVLSDFHEGKAQLNLRPGEVTRSFGAGLSFRQATQLFQDEGYPVDVGDFVENPGFLRSFRMTPAIIQIANNAVNCSLTGALRRMFQEGAALQLYALIFARGTLPPIVGDKPVTQVVANKNAVIEAVDLLLDALENPPTVMELANKTGLSARRLNAGVKELYGCTLFELLTKRRLEAAKHALEVDPNLPIKTLALNVGYAHESNFISAFKRQFSLTPRQYAKTFAK